MIGTPKIVGQPPPYPGEKGSAIGKHPSFRHLLPIRDCCSGLALHRLGSITGYVEKWLWMRQLDYAGIFWTLLSVQWAMFCRHSSSRFCSCGSIFVRSIRNSTALRGDSRRGSAYRPKPMRLAQTGIDLSPRLLKLAVVLVSAVVALFFALGFYSQWDTYLRFRYGGSFGVSDPLFGVDVGFYLFHLPFYQLLQTSLMLLTVLTLVGVVSDLRLLWNSAAERQRQDRGEPECHVTSVRASFYPGRQLGIWALPRSLQSRLLDSGRRLWSRLYGGSCNEDRPLDHGRRLGSGVCAARAQFRPPALQGAALGIRDIRGPLRRRNPHPSRLLSKILCAAERVGARDPVSEALHRVHAQGLPARRHPGNRLSGPGGPDIRGARKEQADDPEHSSVGLSAAACRPINRPRRYASTISSTT